MCKFASIGASLFLSSIIQLMLESQA
uniref:Uncharacterized protein n=1 Tax=Tetranychus urticae TaxID=32264 RepID=T1KSA7_TETUR